MGFQDVGQPLCEFFGLTRSLVAQGASIARIEGMLQNFSGSYGEYLATVRYLAGDGERPRGAILDGFSCDECARADGLGVCCVRGLVDNSGSCRAFGGVSRCVETRSGGDGVEVDGRAVGSGPILHSGRDAAPVSGACVENSDLGEVVAGGGVCDIGTVQGVRDNTKKYVPPAKRGPNGGVSVGRGPNYEKNQLARQRKGKTRGLHGVRQVVRMPTFEACDQSVRDELQRTRADRLVLENKLRAVKLKQELEVAESRDVQQMIQQQRTQLLRQTELNKVQIEKAHGSLSGEVAGSVPIVPTVVGGTVETVLTGGSISPSSSISEAEIRKLHKDFLDSQARIAKLEKDNYKLRFGVHQEDSEGGPDDGAPWDGGEDSMSQDQFSYRSGYMCTPEQREENKKLALELRGW